MPKIQTATQAERDYAETLRRQYGGSLTIKDIAVELGNRSINNTKAIVAALGIPYRLYPGSNKPEYPVLEVAKAILSCEVPA